MFRATAAYVAANALSLWSISGAGTPERRCHPIARNSSAERLPSRLITGPPIGRARSRCGAGVGKSAREFGPRRPAGGPAQRLVGELRLGLELAREVGEVHVDPLAHELVPVELV
jgi:hypothetical protein